MDRQQIMNRRQDEGVEAWAKAGYIGTLNMAVGTGKTITALKAAMRALTDGKLRKGDTIRFMAETNARWLTIEEELDQFNSIFGIDVRELFSFDYQCYQAVPEWTGSAMDVYDEIHCGLTAKYHVAMLESKAPCKIGLSATIAGNKTVFTGEVPDEMKDKVKQSWADTDNGIVTSYINKGQLLQIICPIVYQYDIEEAIKDEVLAPFDTYIVYHQLDDTYATYKQKFGKVTEQKMYDIWLKARNKLYQRNKANGVEKTSEEIKKDANAAAFLGMKMAYFLSNTQSKQRLVKALLALEGKKSIVFSRYKDPMRNLAVVAEGNVKEMVEDFNEGKIRIIGTAQKLKQGITLKGIEVAVMMNYTSQSWELIQQLGRVIRWAPGKVARLYIIVTVGTLEENWYEKMTKMYSENLNLLGHINLNIKGRIDGNSILQRYKALK